MIAETYTNPADRTKDELHALEADLKVLALSNKDLSQSNKTLTETIAAISHPLLSPAVPQAKGPCVDQPVVPDQGAIRDIHATSLIAMPPNILPPIISRQLAPSGDMSVHLQRCMKSVQDLAMTISCALDALQGREKTGSSDIHGSYASLKDTMNQLPNTVQCDHCKQSVAWSHFEPVRSGVELSGPCKCVGQTVPPLAESCSAPISRNRLRAKSDRAAGPRPSSTQVSSGQSQSAGKDKLEFQHDYSIMTEYDAQSHRALQQMQQEQQDRADRLSPARQHHAPQQIQPVQEAQKAQAHPNIQQAQQQARHSQTIDPASFSAIQATYDDQPAPSLRSSGSTQRPKVTPLVSDKAGIQVKDSCVPPACLPESSVTGDEERDAPLSPPSIRPLSPFHSTGTQPAEVSAIQRPQSLAISSDTSGNAVCSPHSSIPYVHTSTSLQRCPQQPGSTFPGSSIPQYKNASGRNPLERSDKISRMFAAMARRKKSQLEAAQHEAISVVARPHDTRQGDSDQDRSERDTHLSQGVINESSRIRRVSSTELPHKRSRPRKSTSKVNDLSSDSQDDTDSCPQRRRRKRARLHSPLDTSKDLNSIGSGSQASTCVDLARIVVGGADNKSVKVSAYKFFNMDHS